MNKTLPTPAEPAQAKISQIGHNYKLVEPGRLPQKFPSAMELVNHLNKHKIKPVNQDIIPSFYQTLLKNEKPK
jgi:hypothetical protein